MPLAQSGGNNVGSSQIVDDQIIDADINSAAAIAWTKISKVGATADDFAQTDKFKTAEVSVSAAEIIASGATPKVLIAAPGAGKLIVVDQILYSYTYGGVAFSGGTSIGAYYDSDTVQLVASCANMQSAASWRQVCSIDDVVVVLTAGTNKSVVLKPTGPAFTDGTGSMKLFIRYRILTL